MTTELQYSEGENGWPLAFSVLSLNPIKLSFAAQKETYSNTDHHLLGWQKNSVFEFFQKTLQKNPNELFDQPNTHRLSDHCNSVYLCMLNCFYCV